MRYTNTSGIYMKELKIFIQEFIHEMTWKERLIVAAYIVFVISLFIGLYGLIIIDG